MKMRCIVRCYFGVLLGDVVATAAPSQQAYLKASNARPNENFGVSVAVSKQTVVIGALNESSGATGINGDQSDTSMRGAGAAYVFVRDGTNWSQEAYLKASNTGFDDHFGCSVAISGDTIVVGAYGEDGGDAWVSGAAYVFVRTGTSWSQQAYLKASNADVQDRFGHSVAISGDTIVVGAIYESGSATGVNGDERDNGALNAGAAYVFVRDGTDWSQQAYLKAPSNGAGDWFGFSVAVSGDIAVVGAHHESSKATGVNGDHTDNSALFAGAAYVFTRSGTVWKHEAYLKAPNTSQFDFFGSSVAVCGNTVVVGASNEDGKATGVNGDPNNVGSYGSGAAFVFVRSGANWSQQAYLKASNTGAADNFGTSVTLSGDTLAVGAHLEDSIATGVDGVGPDPNGEHNSGAAYVFVRSGTRWRQQAYLKASNTGGSDFFGFSVGVSGDTVVVGAANESSAATGVNGDGSNNSIESSGASYAFTGLGIGPTLTLTRDGDRNQVRSVGHAGFSYRLEHATSVEGPWQTLETKSAPPSGLLEFEDANGILAQGFYRMMKE